MINLTIISVNFLMLSILGTSRSSTNTVAHSSTFNIENDLLLAQFDCKTDVDDLYSAAALATLLSHPRYTHIHYYVVAGTYGVQEGLYVSPNALFDLAFGPRWADAHQDDHQALEKLVPIVLAYLRNECDIWIAEAGQSDFSARLVQKIHSIAPYIQTNKRVHLVQHSDWNEEVTSSQSLAYVKSQTDYHKIPDGNIAGNGSAGFRIQKTVPWRDDVKNTRLVRIWEKAISLGKHSNGKEGRYYNEAIGAGGMDFSDLTETYWILGLDQTADVSSFFKEFGR